MLVFAPNQKIIVADDLSKRIECEIGDAIMLEVDTNPSTGYNWLVKNPETYQVILESRQIEKTNSTLIGRKTKETFIFRCVNKGKVDIELLYKRAWEKEILTHCSLKVDVK